MDPFLTNNIKLVFKEVIRFVCEVILS